MKEILYWRYDKRYKERKRPLYYEGNWLFFRLHDLLSEIYDLAIKIQWGLEGRVLKEVEEKKK